MGLLWWFPFGVCGCVRVSSCMMDEAGPFYFRTLSSAAVWLRMKGSHLHPLVRHIPSATSTFSQSASWMDTDGAIFPCISPAFCFESTTCVVPGIALTWFCVSSQVLHDVSHLQWTARRLSLFSVVTLHVFCCTPVVVMVCSESRISCMVGQQQDSV